MKTKIITIICGLCAAFVLNAQKYEAEDAQFSGGTAGETDPTIVDEETASEGKYVQTRDGNLSFTVTIASDGFYDIDVYGNGPNGDDRENTFTIDGGSNISVKFPPEDDGAFTLKNIARGYYLTAGQHTINMVKSWGYVSIDYIEISKASVIIYEAENAEVIGGDSDAASTEAHGAASGGMVLSTKESSVKFNIFIPEAGKYNLSIYVIGDGETSTREALFYIDETHAILDAEAEPDWSRRHSVVCDGDPNLSIKKIIASEYEFTAGDHYVFMDKATDPGAWGWYKLDYLELEKVSGSTAVNDVNGDLNDFTVKAYNNQIIISSLSEAAYNVSVYDIAGKVCYAGNNLSGYSTVSNIQQAGIYLVRIESNDGVRTYKVKL